MARTTVIANERAYGYSPDENARGPLAVWTVLAGRAVDEITGLAPDARVSARVLETGLEPVTGSDGMIGLIVQPYPRLAPSFRPGFEVHLTIGADRYFERELRVPIARTLSAPSLAGDTVLAVDESMGMRGGQAWIVGDPLAVHETVTIANIGPAPSQITLAAAMANGYPVTTPLTPVAPTFIEMGDIALHRMAVVIRGRVMTWVPSSNAFQPTAGATVEIPWIWRRQSDVPIEAAKEPMKLVSLAPGLYADRAVTTDSFQPVVQTPVPGEDKALLADVLPGDDEVAVSNAIGLAPGALLRLDRENPDVGETIQASGIAVTGAMNEPARSALVYPAQRGHRHADTVEHVTAAAALSSKSLDTDGAAGDVALFLTDLTWAGTPGAARIAGGAPDEYQDVRLFFTKTDADGYFALPPISRVAKVRIAVTPTAKPTQNIDLQPEYRSAEQWLDVSFSS